MTSPGAVGVVPSQPLPKIWGDRVKDGIVTGLPRDGCWKWWSGVNCGVGGDMEVADVEFEAAE